MIADFSSSFNLSRASQRVERSMVTLKKTTCVMDPGLGTPIFTVADLELSGYVSNVIFATGTMKVAYEVSTKVCHACFMTTNGISGTSLSL